MLSFRGCIQILQPTRSEGRCWLAAETAAHSRRETVERLHTEVQWVGSLVESWSEFAVTGMGTKLEDLPLCLCQGLTKCALRNSEGEAVGWEFGRNQLGSGTSGLGGRVRVSGGVLGHHLPSASGLKDWCSVTDSSIPGSLYTAVGPPSFRQSPPFCRCRHGTSSCEESAAVNHSFYK